MFGQLDIPTPDECEAILDELQVFANIVRHGRRVAEVAEKLTVQLNDAGLHLNVALVKAAAILHDLAKGRPDHAREGERILEDLGFPEVARVVGLHMDCDFEKNAALDEAAIVYLADKLVQGDRIVIARRALSTEIRSSQGQWDPAIRPKTMGNGTAHGRSGRAHSGCRYTTDYLAAKRLSRTRWWVMHPHH